MKTFNNADQLTGAVMALVEIYSANVNSLEDDKLLHFVITEWNYNKWKVTFKWVGEYRSGDLEPVWSDDFFFFLKTERFATLEKYVNDLMDVVTKEKILT